MKEKEILEKYISGGESGHDNRLKAVIAKLEAEGVKDLSDAVYSLQSTIGSAAANLMTSNSYNAKKLQEGMELSVKNLNEGIAEQVQELIISNERLSKSNEDNALKTHKLSWINIFLTAFMAAAAVVGVWNIFLTKDIKNESIRANKINEQPFIIFNDFDTNPYVVTNSGKGVATNYLMVIWDKYGKNLFITPEAGVGEALGVGMKTRIEPSSLIKTDFEAVQKIPVVSKLIKIAKTKDTAWFAILYEDIYGNPYATLIRGPGGEYTENVKFLDLSKDN